MILILIMMRLVMIITFIDDEPDADNIDYDEANDDHHIVVIVKSS